jgi:Holliday junction resolvase RusA-like endonuclease
VRMNEAQLAEYRAKLEQSPLTPAPKGRRTLKAIVAADGPRVFSAFCAGEPQTQGGTVPLRNKATGKVAQVTKGSKGLPAWRKAMTKAFAAEAAASGLRAPLDGALAFSAVFILPRLSARTMKGRYYGEFAGDMDKQIRACWDSLKKAEVIVDDARICVIRECVKRYAELTETPGVLVRVWRLSLEHATPLGAATAAASSKSNQEEME